MATIAKTVVATGCSSGLGFEAVKQLLQQSQPYRFILGARDATGTRAAYDALKYDAATHSLQVLPLELSDLRGVRTFARQALGGLEGGEGKGKGKLDYLFLNAGMATAAEKVGPHGSKWCRSYVVNHLSQHYLVHLLREKLVSSQSRIVFVSSGAIRGVSDPKTLDTGMRAGSGTASWEVYQESKFAQLLGAHWWRRQLEGSGCKVVAVSPGLIPGTRIVRDADFTLSMDNPGAKTVPEGAQNILRAFTRDDFPADPEQIFLTSWGEWWPKDVYALSLDRKLQDKWCLGKDEIEKDEGLDG